MKLLPTNPVERHCEHASSNVRAFLMMMGLLAFSVVLSLIDQGPQAARSQALEVDRREQQIRPPQMNRGLVKGRGTLRIAAFGSANMWGAGLENRFDALPYLLSNEVDNYAMFSAGPNYPSVCTETIVGDDNMYDVIFLEYWLKASQGLPDLAHRLHERFPRAMIFFVKVWAPLHARRRASEEPGGEEVMFETWRNDRFPPDAQINEVINAIKEDDGYWYFPEHPDADQIINNVRKEVGGYNIRIPKKDTGKETLMSFLHFFNQIHAQLSPMGHEFLANMTKSTIKKKLEGSSVQELVAAAENGSWGGGDSCSLWFTAGGYKSEFSPELVMNNFDPVMGKYAIEVTSKGWLTVENPFDNERTVYVSFLSTVEGVYPEATASIGESGAPVLLVPVNPGDTKGTHNPRTVAIGKVPPGKSKIYITPQGITSNFFRLVGVSITNELAVPLEYGFGPQFNH